MPAWHDGNGGGGGGTGGSDIGRARHRDSKGDATLYMAICNCSLHCINMPSTNDKEKDKDFLKIMQFLKGTLNYLQ